MDNPYNPPRAAVDDMPEQVRRVRLLVPSGRIGRVRYIFYTSALPLLAMLITGLWLSAVHSLSGLGIALIASTWGAVGVIFVLLTIQRAHDFGMSGAVALLGFVPLVNLAFWVIPGTKGGNRFGAPTAPNSTAILLGACFASILLVLVFAAAAFVPGLDRPQTH